VRDEKSVWHDSMTFLSFIFSSVEACVQAKQKIYENNKHKFHGYENDERISFKRAKQLSFAFAVVSSEALLGRNKIYMIFSDSLSIEKSIILQISHFLIILTVF
jgi:hypothetical protein